MEDGHIYIEPDEVWAVARGSDEAILIAEYEDEECEIYAVNDCNGVEISAFRDGECISSRTVSSFVECSDAVRDLYEMYLPYEMEMAEQIDLIDEREIELEYAADEFLGIVLHGANGDCDNGEACEKIVDLVCQYLYKEYGVSIFRPMYLEGEEGESEFFNYPYPEMEID